MEDDNKKVEETEEEPKGLVDRFWWVIPPVFITFVYWPLVGSAFNFGRYIRRLESLFSSDVGTPIFFWSYFLFGSMAVGMLLTRRCSFISLRIIVPIVFAILGWFIGVFVAMSTSPLG